MWKRHRVGWAIIRCIWGMFDQRHLYTLKKRLKKKTAELLRAFNTQLCSISQIYLTCKCFFSSPEKDNVKDLTNPFAPQMLFSGAFGGIIVLRNTPISLLLLFRHSRTSAWSSRSSHARFGSRKRILFIYLFILTLWLYEHFALRKERVSKPESVSKEISV